MTSAFLLKKNKREKEGFKNLKPSFFTARFQTVQGAHKILNSLSKTRTPFLFHAVYNGQPPLRFSFSDFISKTGGGQWSIG